MMKPKVHISIIDAYIIIFLLLNSPCLKSYANDHKAESVTLSGINAQMSRSNDGFTLKISGNIKNKLPIDVADVNISASFPDIKGNPSKSITLPKLRHGKSKHFEMVKKLRNKPSKFNARVQNYRLATNDIDTILRYFWDKNNEGILRQAAVLALKHLSSNTNSMPLIISKFRISEKNISKNLITDLLLLHSFNKCHNLECIQSLLDKSQIYSDPQYQIVFSKLKAIAKRNNTLIPMLNHAAKENKTLNALLKEVIITIGNKAVPTLVANSEGEGYKSKFANQILHELSFDTREKQINHLLSLAKQHDEGSQESIDVLKTLLPELNTTLIKMLEFTDSKGREIITDLLKLQGDKALSAIVEILRQNGMNVYDNFTFDEGLHLLTKFYEQKRLQATKDIYNKALMYLSDGNCILAAKEFDRFLVAENRPQFDIKNIVEAYKCLNSYKKAETLLNDHLTLYSDDTVAKYLLSDILLHAGKNIWREKSYKVAGIFWEEKIAKYPNLSLEEKLGNLYLIELTSAKQNGEWQNAIDFLEKAKKYSKDINLTRNEIGMLYFEAGKESRKIKDWSCAIDYFRKAEQYLEDSKYIKKEMGITIIKQKWSILLLLCIFFVVCAKWIIFSKQ